MPRAKVTTENKIFSYTICLKGKQINWIEEHPEVKINKFFRDQLDKFILLKQKIEEI